MTCLDAEKLIRWLKDANIYDDISNIGVARRSYTISVS